MRLHVLRRFFFAFLQFFNVGTYLCADTSSKNLLVSAITIAHARMMYRHVAFNHTDNYFSTVVDLWEPDRVRGIMTARICDS